MALFFAFLVCTSMAFVVGMGFGATLMRCRLARDLRKGQLDIAPAVARYRRSGR